MKKLLILVPLLFNSCTLSFLEVDTHGVTNLEVEQESTAEPEVWAPLNWMF